MHGGRITWHGRLSTALTALRRRPVGVPLAFLSNELFIKLRGNAARCFQTTFPKTPGDKDVCHRWNDLQAATIHHFTRSYTAAKA